MAHIEKNIMLFNSKLNEFWNCGKYCDTVIEVEGISFNCHQLVLTTASEYFDIMFGGNFGKSKSSHIILDYDIDASIFKEVLRFFYTGNVMITKENVYRVLLASDFFQLDGIVEICTEFILKNLSSLMSQIFEIFSLACRMHEKTLMSGLSEYIMQNFNIFPQDGQVLSLSVEDLNILASQHWHLSPENSERFLSAVAAWVNCGDDAVRNNYREELMGKIELQYIAANCDLHAGSSIDLYPDFRISKEFIPDLHVYTNIFHNDDSFEPSVFSIKRNDFKWKCSSKMSTRGSLGCIGVGDSLYYLIRHQYEEDETPVHEFYSCSSVDVEVDMYMDAYDSNSSNQCIILKSPPGLLMASRVSLCGVQNKIYLSNAVKTYSPIQQAASASESEFTLEQIDQCIYVYNIDIDKWFPVPLLEEELNFSATAARPTTVVNNMLYLITPRKVGGQNIIFLDHRVPKWQKLTSFDDEHSYIGRDIACCAHEEKIYITNTLQNKFGGLRYDVVANKCEKIESLFKQYFDYWYYGDEQYPCPVQKLLSYGSYLWAFSIGANCDSSPCIQVYNSHIQKWRPAPIPEIMTIIRKIHVKPYKYEYDTSITLLDAVAFGSE